MWIYWGGQGVISTSPPPLTLIQGNQARTGVAGRYDFVHAYTCFFCPFLFFLSAKSSSSCLIVSEVFKLPFIWIVSVQSPSKDLTISSPCTDSKGKKGCLPTIILLLIERTRATMEKLFHLAAAMTIHHSVGTIEWQGHDSQPLDADWQNRWD